MTGPRVVVVAEQVGDDHAEDVAATVAEGWARTAPHVSLETFGSHRGGAGLADLVRRAKGGTSHPVWFKDDPRVANVKVQGGVMNRPVMEAVVATTAAVESDIKTLPRDQWDDALAEVVGHAHGRLDLDASVRS